MMGYPACAAACLEKASELCLAAGVSPHGLLACATVSATLCLAACACFDQGTPLHTPAGLRPISELAPGDFVTTLMDGRAVDHRVTAVFAVHGDFEFSMLEATTGWLNVTTQHPVYVQRDSQVVRQAAGSLRIGDVLMGVTRRVEVPSIVKNIQKVGKDVKWVVETELGSVLAGGILVGTPTRGEVSQWMGWSAMGVQDVSAFLSSHQSICPIV